MFYNRLDKNISTNTDIEEKITDTVYLYKDKATKKKFILKVQEEPFDNPEEDKEILLQEFRKLVYLSNEQEIATVEYLLTVDDNKIGYLMEYIDGITLNDHLKKNSIALSEAVDLMSQILLGIEKAHGKDIYHNDLRHMNNILITNNGFIKIIDFLDFKLLTNKEETSENDINSLKIIANAFLDNLQDEKEKKLFFEIVTYINRIDKVKGCTQTIFKIYEMLSDVIIYFNPYVYRIFLLLIKDIENIDKDFNFLFKTFTIDLIEPNIIQLMQGATTNTSIQSFIEKKYTLIFIFLESLGFMLKPNIKINNIENNKCNYTVLLILTPRFIKLAKFINTHKLMMHYKSKDDLSRTIHDYVFTDVKDLLNEPNLIQHINELLKSAEAQNPDILKKS